MQHCCSCVSPKSMLLPPPSGFGVQMNELDGRIGEIMEPIKNEHAYLHNNKSTCSYVNNSNLLWSVFDFSLPPYLLLDSLLYYFIFCFGFVVFAPICLSSSCPIYRHIETCREAHTALPWLHITQVSVITSIFRFQSASEWIGVQFISMILPTSQIH